MFRAFPALREGGGIEIMISKHGKRSELVTASVGPVPVSELKHLTTGRIYIKPLQQDIPLNFPGF